MIRVIFHNFQLIKNFSWNVLKISEEEWASIKYESDFLIKSRFYYFKQRRTKNLTLRSKDCVAALYVDVDEEYFYINANNLQRKVF